MAGYKRPAPALRRTLAVCALYAASLAGTAFIAGCGSAAPPLPEYSAAAIMSCSGAVPDSDADGIADLCEQQLAIAFAPLLRAGAATCSVIRSGNRSLLGGGYLYAVAPIDGGARLVYMPAYFQDCGWSGPKCALHIVSCAPHAGDSELIAIDITPAGGTYSVNGIFLSAHCFDSDNPRCGWYRGRALETFVWAGPVRASAPVVWVADGKHANYPSKRACDGGKWFFDTCDAPRLDYRYPIVRGRNVGARSAAACIDARVVDPEGAHTAAGSMECVWNPAMRFRGWQASTHPGATPYERYLREIGGM
jgi:hypothetical protein